MKKKICVNGYRKFCLENDLQRNSNPAPLTSSPRRHLTCMCFTRHQRFCRQSARHEQNPSVEKTTTTEMNNFLSNFVSTEIIKIHSGTARWNKIKSTYGNFTYWAFWFKKKQKWRFWMKRFLTTWKIAIEASVGEKTTCSHGQTWDRKSRKKIYCIFAKFRLSACWCKEQNWHFFYGIIVCHNIRTFDWDSDGRNRTGSYGEI